METKVQACTMSNDGNGVSSRVELIRKYFTPLQLGIEIGPFHSPICPKSQGYNCLVVDAFSRDQLLKDYANDPYVMERADSIEEVDIVTMEPLGEALEIYAQKIYARTSTVQATLDYIVSSHNFEHQPNPIRFLRDAEQYIRPGGHLVMAIPIASRCFDCFQPLSRTGELIDAFYQQKRKPSVGNVFDHQASSSKLIDKEGINDLTYEFDKVMMDTFAGSIDDTIFEKMREAADVSYIDSHCWRFNPYHFELVFSDVKACGLIKYLSISEIITQGSEFIAYIERSEEKTNQQPLSAHKRTELMKQSLLFQFNDLLNSVTHTRNDASLDQPEINAIISEALPTHPSLRAKIRSILNSLVAKNKA